MIAKKEWFERRKYGGWGLHPKTWQGWAYIVAMIVPFTIFQALPFWTDEVRFAATGVFLAVLMLDMIPIMLTVKRDELEDKIESKSERNAAWVMVAVLTAGVLYDLIIHALKEEFYVNPFVAGALAAGVIVKTVSNFYYERKGV